MHFDRRFLADECFEDLTNPRKAIVYFKYKLLQNIDKTKNICFKCNRTFKDMNFVQCQHCLRYSHISCYYLENQKHKIYNFCSLLKSV